MIEVPGRLQSWFLQDIVGVCDDKLSVTAGINDSGSYVPELFEVQQPLSLDVEACCRSLQCANCVIRCCSKTAVSHIARPLACKGTHDHQPARTIISG